LRDRPGEPIRALFQPHLAPAPRLTFVISICTLNVKFFAAVVPIAEKIIDSVRLPATVSAG